ncbi:MAG: DNRLRE domain-containing protein [Nitrosopumilaceae archaeon]
MWQNQSTIVSVAYLQFDLSEYETESIQKATLYMFASGVELDNNPTNIALIFVDDDNWNESKITYLQRPFFSTTIDTISAISEPNKWYNWDITEVVRNNNDSKLSLALTFETGKDFTSDLATFYSKETAYEENAPYLEIKYVSEQPANYILAIIGGVIVTAVISAIVLKHSRKIRK